jgi:hypothetical protein
MQQQQQKQRCWQISIGDEGGGCEQLALPAHWYITESKAAASAARARAGLD